MLPDMDGFSLCREIRRSTDVPVIMVTARTDSHDIVAGLEVGADDYVTKPVIAKELSARIRALTRRTKQAPRAELRHIKVGDLEILPDQGRVQRDGVPLQLTRTEFRLMVELSQAGGAVRSREELRDKVWGYGHLSDTRLVDVHIRRLRLKVERDPGNPRHVVTVRGLGYRLAG
jgi:DNA-binding response OmpR family regulator